EAAHSLTNCLAIPKNSTKQKQAAQFIKYFAGKKTQSKLLENIDAVPVNMSQISEFEAKTTSDIPNRPAVARAVAYSTPGDWSYVEDGLWINGWANILNSKVRDGDMTLEQFFSNATVIATDATLATYKSKKYSGR
ncbi:MAG: hypothetical protein K2L87_04285, partial [Clostridiales bacterium]|nr:hypothetical protein [Clostridiales bacterium]